MQHYIFKLDETYWANESGILKIYNVLTQNTESYIINPTLMNTNGFNKNSVLNKTEFSSLFQNLSPPDLIVASASEYTLSNWTSLGWGSTLSDVLNNYQAFIDANITSSPYKLDINPGSYDMTTALVYGTVGGTSYFLPVLLFSDRGRSVLNSNLGTETFYSTSGLTQQINTSFDDANYLLPTLPFSWYFFGTDYSSSVYVGSNTYITFGFGSSNYSGLSATNPGRGILVGASDNSYQRVWHGTKTLGNKTVFVVRYEGNGSTGGVVGSPGIVVQWTFFDQQRLNITVGVHNRLNGLTGISDGFSFNYSGSWTLAENTSYALSSDPSGNNWVVASGQYFSY